MKIDHNIIIGNQVYPVKVKAKKNDGKLAIDVDDLSRKQKKIASELLVETREYNQALANYVLNVVGIKGSVIAECMEVSPPKISQIRKGDCSSQLWKFFRLIMISLLAEKRDRDIDKVIFEKGAA